MKSGALTLLAALSVLAVGCSSSSDGQGLGAAGQTSGTAGQNAAGAGAGGEVAQGGASGAQTSDTSAAVSGPSDTHCSNRPLGVSDPSICLSSGVSVGGSSGGVGGADNAETGGASAGNGGADCNQSHDSGYGDNLYDSAGDDDDCKYHVSWTATPVAKGKPFTLTVTATSKATGEPLEHIAAQEPGKPALSRIEPFMPCEPSHLAPTSDYEAPVTEVGPGTFTVGPVVFDESGRWVIRYHFYEECLNNVTTPHAHIAFFVNVP